MLQPLFDNKDQPLKWSPWPPEWPQLACQGVLVGPVDGWLHYCTAVCCVTTSCMQHFRSSFPTWGCFCMFAQEEKYFENNKQTRKYLMEKYFLLISGWLQRAKVKAVVKRSTSCWIWPGNHGLSSESRHRKQAENRSAAVHSFDWIGEAEQHWRKFQMESRISRSKTAKTNKVARGPPHRHPACYLNHITQAWRLPMLATRPLKMDEQQEGR